jgi:hypothetical protein
MLHTVVHRETCLHFVLSLVLVSAPAALALPVAASDHVREEPSDAGWALHVDNDGFLTGDSDQNYTGGVALEFFGQRARDWPVSLHTPLAWIDRLFWVDRLTHASTSPATHGLTIGLAAFTPQDISVSEPQFDDHPYASLVFLASTRQFVHPERRTSYQSTLALGLLGTQVAEGVQNALHALVGSGRAEGWDNQISDGGEPTFRYTLHRQQLLWQGAVAEDKQWEWHWGMDASLGYLTQASTGLSTRWGRIRSPWWSFDSSSVDFVLPGQRPASNRSALRGREWYVWAGADIKARAYNSLLQGQFRDSAVTFDRDELRDVLVAGGVGLVMDLTDSGLRGEFSLRAQTGELRENGVPNPLWVRITLSRRY